MTRPRRKLQRHRTHHADVLRWAWIRPVEALETRMLLSTWTVNTLSDPATYDPGDMEISLREASARPRLGIQSLSIRH